MTTVRTCLNRLFRSESRDTQFLFLVGFLIQGLLVALVLTVYRMPRDFTNIYGTNHSVLLLFQKGWSLPPSSALGARAFSVTLAALLLGLLILSCTAYWIVRRSRKHSRFLLPVIIFWSLSFHLFLALFFPPAFSADINYYVASARLMEIYGQNPYIDSLKTMAGDPVLQMPLVDIPSSYGPVWNLMAAGLENITKGKSVFIDQVAFKIMVALLSLMSTVLVYLIAAHKRQRNGAEALLFYSWNPFFLFEIPGNGHNDISMLFLILLAIFLYQRRYFQLGFASLVLAVLTKWVAGFCAFYYLVLRLKELSSKKEMLRSTVISGVMSTGITLISFAFFWEGWRTFQGLSEVSLWIRLTPMLLPLHLLEELLLLTSATAVQAQAIAMTVFTLLQKAFIVLYMLWCSRRIWLKEKPEEGVTVLSSYWERTIILYIIFVHSAIFPWYFLWPMVTAPLGKREGGRHRLVFINLSLASFAFVLYALHIE